MGLVKGAAVEPAVVPREHAHTHPPTYQVIALITQDGGDQQDPHGQGQIHQAGTTHSSSDEEQGIARQKRHQHHAGFDKNNRKQQGINPSPVALHKLANVAVHVQHKVDQ